jgi:hypothetical protein
MFLQPMMLEISEYRLELIHTVAAIGYDYSKQMKFRSTIFREIIMVSTGWTVWRHNRKFIIFDNGVLSPFLGGINVVLTLDQWKQMFKEERALVIIKARGRSKGHLNCI